MSQQSAAYFRAWRKRNLAHMKAYEAKRREGTRTHKYTKAQIKASQRQQEAVKTIGGRQLVSCEYKTRGQLNHKFGAYAFAASVGTHNGRPMYRAA